jgi:hypothetical protein
LRGALCSPDDVLTSFLEILSIPKELEVLVTLST